MVNRFNLILNDLILEAKLLRVYLVTAVIVICLSFLCYAVFNESTMEVIGEEDGFFEDLTAICFLFAAFIFLLTFLKKKEIIYLLFFLVFLFGAGEEISWGQRIFNFETPGYFEKNNLQDEFNIHNLEVFNNNNPNYDKTGISKILSINFEFKLFCLLYCFVLPIIIRFSSFINRVVRNFKVPVPPISIGLLFIFNWVTFRITLSFLLPEGKSALYYASSVEISEFCSSFLFLMLSHYFLMAAKGSARQYKIFSLSNSIPAVENSRNI